ncbi:MAG: choice-of-anchor Q domain-containing protein [Anaerolineales bacterium]
MRRVLTAILLLCLLFVYAQPAWANGGVIDSAGNALVDPYTSGETYQVVKETPTPTVTPTLPPTPTGTPAPLDKIYVNASAMGANNGTSWQNAFTDLQSALVVATAGKQIWVAKGVYYPGTTRTATFLLKEGVELYGGFAGNETQLSQRNPSLNPTVLSGDVDRNDRKDSNGVTWGGDITGSNAYHVVTAGSGITSATILDGFVITAGQASGENSNKYGGGLLITGSPTLRNLRVIGNTAQEKGGGVYITGSGVMPQLLRVEFRANSSVFGGGLAISNASGATVLDSIFAENAAQFGAGLFSEFLQSSLTVIGTTFVNNNAQYNGGGINHYGAGLAVVNSTFSANVAFLGGGLYNTGNGTPSLTNVTMSDNRANYGGAIYNDQGVIRLTNSILANSQSGGDCVNSANASLHSQSANNLVESTGSQACGLVHGSNGNLVGVDPLLDVLANNGGNTQTHALLSGSPAAGMGKASSCPEVDQRGTTRPRPAGSACDIGAFESDEPLPPTPTPSPITPTTTEVTPTPTPVTPTPGGGGGSNPTPIPTGTTNPPNPQDGTPTPTPVLPPTGSYKVFLPLVVK